MKRISGLILATIAAFLIFTAVATVIQGQEKKVDPPAKLEATKQPTEQWLKDYDDFLALQSAITKLKQKYGIDKLEVELNTQGQALLGQVPVGYQFDQAKKQFVAVAKAEPLKK